MIDVTVKTLDGKNRSFSVPEEITVKSFKEKIATSIEIPAEAQRLIFQGRVLLDEKKLNFYDVHGKVVHVVQRAPPSRQQGPSSGASATAGPPPEGGMPHAVHEHSSVVIRSFSLPGEGMDPQQVQNIVSDTLSGMGDIGRNARISSRPSADGSGVDVHINLGDIQVGPAQPQSHCHRRITQAQHMIKEAHKALDKLQNPDSSSETSQDEEMASPERAEGSAEASPESEPQAEGNDEEPSPPQNQPVQHPPPSLAAVFDELSALQQRLQPYLERYHEFLRTDPALEGETAQRDTQRLCDHVAQVLHYISHAYHHISDIMVQTSQSPPRQLTAPPVVVQVQRVVRQAIPVVAEVNLAHPPMSGQPPTSQPSPSTTRAATSSASSTASTTSSSSTPRTASSTTAQPGIPLMPFPPLGPHGGVMVMEVGPDGVHINSMPMGAPPRAETTTTSSSGANPPSQGQPRPPMPPMGIPSFHVGGGGVHPGGPMHMPPELMQGVMQAVNQAIAQAGGAPPAAASAPQGAPPPRSSTSTTTTSSSNSSSTTSGPPPPPPPPPGAGVHIVSGPPPGADFGGPPLPGFSFPRSMGAIDPCLPCQSRHFVNQRAAHAAQQPAQNPDQVVANAVSNLISSLVSPNAQATSNTSSQSTAGTSTTTTTTTTSRTPSSQPTQAGPNPVISMLQGAFGSLPANRGAQQPYSVPQNLPFLDALRGVLQQGNPGGTQPTTSTANTASSTTTSATTARPSQTAPSQPQTGTQATNSSGGGEQNMSDEVFAELVRGIGGYMTQAAMGQQPQDTIADFLNTLGQNYQIHQGEGFLTDVFNAVAQHLTFVDLMAVFFGQSEPLNRVRGPLQEFIRQRVLNGSEPSELNISVGVDRLLGDMQDEVRAACADVQPHHNIDLPATITQFLRQQLLVLVRFIMGADGNNFGQQLFDRCQRVIHEFIALCCRCLPGGMDDLDRIVQQYVRRVSTDINPMIQTWMGSMTSQQLRNISPNVTITQEQVEHYIVHHGEVADDSSSASAQAMDVDEDMDAAEPEDVRERAQAVIRQARSSLPPPPTRNPRDNTPVELGSESWHSVVPREWVNVISQDSQRQQRMEPQRPFSDAYRNCMPPKRRKVVAEAKPEYDSGDMSTVLPESLRQAVGAAGVQPVTSMDQLYRDASESAALHRAFGQEVRQTVRDRIRRDSDYVPEKFPNSEKYFKEGK